MLAGNNSTTRSILFLSIFVSATTQCVAADKVASDTCVLEINTAKEATITVDGRDYGRKRKLIFRSLEPDRRYKTELSARIPGASPVSKSVFIAGGHRIVVRLAAPSNSKPQLLLQSGHNSSIIAMSGSPDGQLIATSGTDNVVIVWDANTGVQLRSFHKHTANVTSLDFSPDGKHIVSAASRGVYVWEVSSGKVSQSIRGANLKHVQKKDEHFFPHVARFTTDGRFILIGGGTVHLDPRTLKSQLGSFLGLWETRSGKLARIYRGVDDLALRPNGAPGIVAVSPDGKTIAAASRDHTIHLWNIQTGSVLRTLGKLEDAVRALAFSPDGKYLAFGGDLGELVVWDVDTGRKHLSKVLDYEMFNSVHWNPKGNQLLVTGEDNVLLIDVNRGTQRTLPHNLDGDSIGRFVNGCEKIVVAAQSLVLLRADPLERIGNFAPKRTNHIIHFAPPNAAGVFAAHYSNGQDSQIVFWDKETGTQESRLSIGRVVALSKDGRTVAYDDKSGFLAIRRFDGTTQVQRLTVKSNAIRTAQLGSRGRVLVVIEKNGKMRSWNTENGTQLVSLGEAHDGSLIAISHDSRLLAEEHNDKIVVWNLVDGRRIVQFTPQMKTKFKNGLTGEVPQIWIRSLCFHPNGRSLLVGGNQGVMEYDISTAKRTTQRAISGISSATYGPAGNIMLGGTTDGGLFVRYSQPDFLHGAVHDDELTGVAIDPTANLNLSVSADGTIVLSDTPTGDLLARIILLNGGKDWAIVSYDGLFDGSPGGRQLVRFRVGDSQEVVSADRFFQDFYYPGLMAALFRGERPMPTANFAARMAPKVRVLDALQDSQLESPQVSFTVEVTDQGGGVKGPWLTHNGARLLSRGADRNEGKKVYRDFTVSLIEGENKIEVHAASDDGSWESEPAQLTLTYRQPLESSHLYVVAVGVSQYGDEKLNLNYAARDASSMAQLFSRRGPALYGEDHIHVAQLSDEQATKSTIQRALAIAAQRTKPQDTLLLYLSGHGAMVDKQYYFLPHGFKRSEGLLEEDIRTQGLAGSELDEAIQAVPALKRVVIYDTCQSGKALPLASKSRNPFAFRGALERMTRATGSFTIAAASATAEAQEVEQLGHGVLTYALLAGLRATSTGPLKDKHVTSADSVVQVQDWFDFAQDNVPELTKRYLGHQQFLTASGQGLSFPLLPVKD